VFGLGNPLYFSQLLLQRPALLLLLFWEGRNLFPLPVYVVGQPVQ
jgi:hypothetical protein